MAYTDALQSLKALLATIRDLKAANDVLSWDQQTYMPAGGINTRAEQMATVSRLIHERATSAELGALLDRLDGQLDSETDDGALVRIARRDFEHDTKLSADLVERLSRATALADAVWVQARLTSDWSLFAPHLRTIVELQREMAEQYGYTTHPFDALINVDEPGTTKAQIEQMYRELKVGTLPLMKAIRQQQDDDRTRPLHGQFDEARQEQFGMEVIKRFGFDWNRGRQDRAVHPFCTNFSMNDVRLTTRFDPTWLAPAMFGTMHEAGHGMYEQGVAQRFTRSPLAAGCSMGIHESQSRLWENLVGRSRPFWEFFYAPLQNLFPEQLQSVDLDTFYRAINSVQPSLIRVEADELTYNLHTLLRFEVELGLLEGTLKVEEVPALWNAKVAEYLGITPPNDTLGALQDVHWSAGLFAYFPTYTVGNVLAVQFFDAAVAASPAIPDEMRQGEFGTLHGWLNENIYQHGRKYDPNDLVQRATGRPMDTAPYISYLKTKYGALYKL
ncbi:MAG: carboxypeptidase M32 [Herpetosiphonaceae bacterium]|nr:carboxypeptidase M32 [Herpetosiphonaceae bacterium]